MTIGGYDESLAVSDIHYHDVNSNYYWSLTASDILLDGESVGMCGDGGCNLITDTGTSFITLPSAHWELIDPYFNLNDCKDFRELPTFTFVIDDEHYILTPD